MKDLGSIPQFINKNLWGCRQKIWICIFKYLKLLWDTSIIENSWRRVDLFMSTLSFRTNNDLLFWNVGYSSSLKITIAQIPSLAHPRERIWEWNGKGGAETKIPLTSSIAESDRAQAWWQKRAKPPNQRAFDPYHGWWKSTICLFP